MKTQLMTILASTVIGFSLMAMCDVASAACWVTRGYWSGGYWHAGHRVCDRYSYKRCGYVKGYRDRHGYWHRGYRAC